MASTEHNRRELANGIRALSMDAVQRANSGHPGAPMGMADIAEVLWRDFLRHNPQQPDWIDRDRFVLSNGHGSMLLYSLLHLSGYDLSVDDLKNFRQLHSRTPGHPEYGYTSGVETTTGPLGQGLTNAVGMALAEKMLAGKFNRPGHDVIDHYTYVFAGDGCLMEGVSHEACSLAGTLGLGKLITFYDNNSISIDGDVSGWYTEDVNKRFEAYGWQVIGPIDGHDPAAIKAAIEQARADTSRPSLINCRTVIGWGSPKMAGTSAVHGAPLGDDEIAATREELGWQYGPFEIPAEHYQAWDARQSGERLVQEWQQAFAAYREAYPELAAELERRMRGELPANWQQVVDEALDKFGKAKKDATRKSSQAVLDHIGPQLPELLGGSADLTGSNNTWWSGCQQVSADSPDGNYIFYGVREFAMTAIMNGVALHGGWIPYGGTFLIFSDYARNAVRMAALMKQRTILVYTHDSIGLGEDGPTHQPIEQLNSLRMIPNLEVWRPCDAQETAGAWAAAIERRSGPTAMALSRQGMEPQARSADQVKAIARGGYVLSDASSAPELVLLATGSEVELAQAAAEQLKAAGRSVRVVSMPCVERFQAQDSAYRSEVLPAGVPRLSIEAGSTGLWQGLVGDNGAAMGIDGFGESAPGPQLYEYFGLTVDNVVATAQRLLA
ncbi:transketolase [Halorhodospira halochloris]|uniref:Transketolase n=1 Tax=Halorhodospira halochloris TaxID=1052 RepID=A0A0X8X7N2_HALHR|nr:transketolase [Halorhodospira halochloris]MBK1650957.1 transketolase [Halorhodospira halochloris]MCG5547299.1 transketolase [Halorhodospira halochloris]BAU56537.1 transketolase [Halorhodospira halochloris]